ncbi:hypothetical protein SAMN04490186_5190 [Pseudomonas grimontii]|uniref:Uncharacterized protein n=1 Tax=Pseudomonas grimontii TaxID=129847 RepID=A0A1H1I5E5_9PSED|nr:hypothetical protein [Pseudomonas grimontii]TWR65705.1 hypothetical protein FIV39_14020 [Pseudomonas grimontii]SDR32937.1 hypothetical protein SAMN04490186_5190 [Pseudomonas grimontii]
MLNLDQLFRSKEKPEPNVATIEGQGDGCLLADQYQEALDLYWQIESPGRLLREKILFAKLCIGSVGGNDGDLIGDDLNSSSQMGLELQVEAIHRIHQRWDSDLKPDEYEKPKELIRLTTWIRDHVDFNPYAGRLVLMSWYGVSMHNRRGHQSFIDLHRVVYPTLTTGGKWHSELLNALADRDRDAVFALLDTIDFETAPNMATVCRAANFVAKKEIAQQAARVFVARYSKLEEKMYRALVSAAVMSNQVDLLDSIPNEYADDFLSDPLVELFSYASSGQFERAAFVLERTNVDTLVCYQSPCMVEGYTRFLPEGPYDSWPSMFQPLDGFELELFRRLPNTESSNRFRLLLLNDAQYAFGEVFTNCVQQLWAEAPSYEVAELLSEFSTKDLKTLGALMIDYLEKYEFEEGEDVDALELLSGWDDVDLKFGPLFDGAKAQLKKVASANRLRVLSMLFPFAKRNIAKVNRDEDCSNNYLGWLAELAEVAPTRYGVEYIFRQANLGDYQGALASLERLNLEPSRDVVFAYGWVGTNTDSYALLTAFEKAVEIDAKLHEVERIQTIRPEVRAKLQRLAATQLHLDFEGEQVVCPVPAPLPANLYSAMETIDQSLVSLSPAEILTLQIWLGQRYKGIDSSIPPAAGNHLVIDSWNGCLRRAKLALKGENQILSLAKRHGYSKVIEVMAEAFAHESKPDLALTALAKTLAQRIDTGANEVAYLIGTIRNRCNYHNPNIVREQVREAAKRGISVSQLQELATEISSWTMWKNKVEDLLEK